MTPDDVERWVAYLSSKHLPDLQDYAAREVVLEAVLVGLSPPASSQDDDGGLHLAWNTESHHLDVTVDKLGRCDWFFRPPAGQSAQGTEDQPDASVSDALVECLRAMGRAAGKAI